MSDTPPESPSPPSSARPGKFIPRDRLEYVEKLYLQGVPDVKIQVLTAKKFGLTRRRVRTYLTLIREKLATLPKPPPETVFQQVQAMLLESYALARKAVKVVTVYERGQKVTRIFPAPETSVMTATAWRYAELHGIASSKLKVDVNSLADFLGQAFVEVAAQTLLPGQIAPEGLPSSADDVPPTEETKPKETT